MNPRFYRKFNYDRSLLPNQLLRQKEETVVDLESAQNETGKTVGYPGWNLLYYCCLCSLDPESEHTIIETGTNWGFSTIVLAQALKDSGAKGKIHTIELDESNLKIAQNNFESAGLSEYVEAHLGDSLEILPTVISKQRLSFAFLDGNHSMSHVLQEFAMVEKHLKPGAKVFFDNTEDIGQTDDLLVFGALKVIEDKYDGNLVRFPYCSWYTPGQAIWEKPYE
jgi:predicted O-methyltransferase YrrM